MNVTFHEIFAGESLNTSLLNPYLDSMVGSKFQNGANFAIVGSTTLPRYVPFVLNIQLMQFLHFKSRALELASTSGISTYLIPTNSLSINVVSTLTL